MYEVFNYVTGETYGFTDDYFSALWYAGHRESADYINADEECSCTLSNPHCKETN
jgi:hypothetical protein